MRSVWLALSLLLACFPASSHASPLLDAVKKGDIAAITSVLDGGVDVNQVQGRSTPLSAAVARGNLEVARLLIERGADVNLAAKYSGTPLQIAAMSRNETIIEVLLSSGAKPDLAPIGLTPLQTAAENGCLPCVRLLVEAGAEVNLTTPDLRRPALHFAKKNGHQEIANYLLEHGAKKPTLPSITPSLAAADPVAGKDIYQGMCGRCHKETVSPYAPPLWNVVGRRKASIADYSYSPAMKAEEGEWGFDSLNAFIFSPMQDVPGTEMAFEGIQDEPRRAAVIAYLRTLSDAPAPLP